jgi:hypothetical protein
MLLLLTQVRRVTSAVSAPTKVVSSDAAVASSAAAVAVTVAAAGSKLLLLKRKVKRAALWLSGNALTVGESSSTSTDMLLLDSEDRAYFRVGKVS